MLSLLVKLHSLVLGVTQLANVRYDLPQTFASELPLVCVKAGTRHGSGLRSFYGQPITYVLLQGSGCSPARRPQVVGVRDSPVPVRPPRHIHHPHALQGFHLHERLTL